MKIRVKHRNTEVEVSDDGKDDKSLLYHNEKYSVEMLFEVTRCVKEIIEKENEILKQLNNE